MPKLNLNVACNKLMLHLCHILLVITLVSFFGVYMFPFWTGEVIPSGGTILQDYRSRIPSYYYDAANWINNQSGDFAIFVLPHRSGPGGAGMAFTWGAGGSLLKSIIHKPIIRYRVSAYPETLDMIYDLLRQRSNTPDYPFIDIGRFLGLMNIRFILLLNDFAAGWSDVDSPREIKIWLEVQRGIHLNRTFGEIDIYKVETFVPRIYATDIIPSQNRTFKPTKLVFQYEAEENPTSGLVSSFLNQAGWIVFLDREVATYYKKSPNATISYNIQIPKGTYEVYAKINWGSAKGTLKYRIDNGSWSEGVTPRWDLGGIGGEYRVTKLGESFIQGGTHTITFINAKPYTGDGYQNIDYFFFYSSAKNDIVPGTDISVTYQRMDPTRYKVQVKAPEPFLLVLTEAYHPEWKAYYGDVNWLQSLWEEPIIEDNHFMVNGYTNAWYVNKTGEFELTLYFKPQSSFYLGLFISVLSFVIVDHIIFRTGYRFVKYIHRIGKDGYASIKKKLLPKGLDFSEC